MAHIPDFLWVKMGKNRKTKNKKREEHKKTIPKKEQETKKTKEITGKPQNKGERKKKTQISQKPFHYTTYSSIFLFFPSLLYLSFVHHEFFLSP